MEDFLLKGEYIALSQLLKAARWVPSGGIANMLIDDGEIKVNSEEELRRRRKLRPGDIISWEDKLIKIVTLEDS